ncbi:MAG: DNA primase [Epsilonproteobacteria bacterium]|nr:DNA primase [Campylobacterota bacterium]|tara:strand:- start:235 stop:1986 length:1752 start_codon:yes stop_codon:yes gene_type:complete
MDLFNFIKNQLDIITVISEYTNLKKTGSQYWKALCPFHHEKTPSFSVSPHKKIFYCFGCQETGDVINFIEKIENISAYEAAQHIIQRYNIDVPDTIEKNSSLKKEKTPFQLCQLVAQWCNNKLLKNKVALTYIQDRKVSSNTISQFTIGFFPVGTKAIQDLVSYIMNNGFSTKELLQEHILFQGKGALYSPFENRIMFPIKDHLGQTCGFGGRIFKPNDQRPKYYNSKETTFFKKGKILFGLDIAKHYIQKSKTAFIVEGYTDCIAMYQHGYHNTVATLGTACTLDHLKQLAKHAQTVYMLYDGDNAGKQAILRLTQSCWQLDMDLKVILLPPNQDPASILEKEKTIDTYIATGSDIFTYFLHATGKNFQKHSIRDKMIAINDLLHIIKNIQDDLKQNILLMKAAEIMQIPLDILKKQYTNRDKPVITNTQKTSSIQKQIDPDNELEVQILATICHDPTVITKQDETLLLAKLSEPIKNIFTKIMQHHNSASSSLEAQKLENILTQQELQYTQQILFKIETTNIKQTFVNLMSQFQKKHWKSLVSHIKMKLMQAKQANNRQEMLELLEVFEKLKKDLYKNGRL